MKKYILTLCLALIGLSMMAQNITVSGVVTSKTDGEPLIGATVRVKGTNQGTATDIDGNYTLPNVAKNATLIFNYVGFAELSLPVGGQTTVNAALTETTSALDELVVVGYGVAKKSDLTSSISTIKGGEINEMVAGNAMDALQGRVPGVQVASGGGPGTTPKVMIRGVTSVNGSNPLYVVDGVPLNTSNINFINNNDIESMEVLKDASASAIYGTRASNGVIIITTKKGKSGQTHVDFSASVGWQHISKPSIAGANEYEKVFNRSYDDVSEFDIAQYMSRIIHNDITMAGCSSWSYWTAMSVERWSQKNRFELIKTTPAGGNYSDDFTAEGNAVATPNLWVLGNYSLFVRPGYRRVDLTLDESKDFFGTAYIAPDNTRLVLVITNYDKERGVSLAMDAPKDAKSVYTYTTTATKQMKQTQFNLKDKVFVDPASVTTIVYNF